MKIGTVAIRILIKDTYSVVKENLIIPIDTWFGRTSSSVLKNMQLVIMVRKRSAYAHVSRCTRVKVLCCGRMSMDSHKWFSVALNRAWSDISWSYEVKVWCDVTEIILSTIPSSCSTANHLSHRNVNLKLKIE